MSTADSSMLAQPYQVEVDKKRDTYDGRIEQSQTNRQRVRADVNFNPPEKSKVPSNEQDLDFVPPKVQLLNEEHKDEVPMGAPEKEQKRKGQISIFNIKGNDMVDRTGPSITDSSTQSPLIQHVSQLQQTDYPNKFVNYRENFDKDAMEFFMDLYFNENSTSYEENDSPVAWGPVAWGPVAGGAYKDNCSKIRLYDFIFVDNIDKTKRLLKDINTYLEKDHNMFDHDTSTKSDDNENYNKLKRQIFNLADICHDMTEARGNLPVNFISDCFDGITKDLEEYPQICEYILPSKNAKLLWFTCAVKDCTNADSNIIFGGQEGDEDGGEKMNNWICDIVH